MLIVVDVGNSGAKAGLFDGETLRAQVRFLTSEISSPDHLARLLDIRPDDVEAIVAVSVSEPLLAEFLSGPGLGAVVLGRDLPLLVENRYIDPAEVGADRLVNCAAAHTIAGGAAVAVDLGSAVTVDAVSADGAFLGGAIAPGLPSLRAGLRSAAPALPEWVREAPRADLPRSTLQAVNWGILHGLAGMVDRLIAKVSECVGDGAPVYLTGGDADLVAGLLSVAPVVVPHLTLDGVRILYDRARRA